VAGKLIDRWILWAREQGVTDLALEVRVSNEAAMGLYRRFGFVEQGRRRGYYERPVEDAVLMGRGV
jgi:ribosomal-protein-alanine N-acetyltransferase